LTPIFEFIGTDFSPYIVAVVCLIHVNLSQTNRNEEEIEKVFDKSLWSLNDNFLLPPIK
jgi:hypothetical protein